MSERVGRVERAVLAALVKPVGAKSKLVPGALSLTQLIERAYEDGEVTASRRVVMSRTVKRLADEGRVSAHHEGRWGAHGCELFVRIPPNVNDPARHAVMSALGAIGAKMKASHPIARG